VALGRLEVDEPLRAEPLFLRARADHHLAGEHGHQRVLVDLVLGQALARGEGQQDDPVGLVV
jgi:hypothetical protein